MRPYFEDESVTIYHGDCRELLPMMPKVDLVLTDPPWGIGYDVAGRQDAKFRQANGTTKNSKHIAPQDFGVFSWDKERFEPAPLLALKTKSIIWGAQCFASRLPDFVTWLCWIKVNGDYSLLRQADMDLAWTNCIGRSRVFNHLWMGGARDSESGIPNYHPTQKPLALMRWCLGLVKDVQTVIDPYMGSGTTLRAAKDTGIKAIGIEIEERYCEIAARRMAQEVLSFESAAVEVSAAALFEE